MKVIFVDVDGVLNSDDFIDSVKGKQDIDIKTVLLLKRAIEETGAKIVMDTSFRYTQSFLKVQECCYKMELCLIKHLLLIMKEEKK